MFGGRRVTKKVVEHLPPAARLFFKSVPGPASQLAVSFWLNRIFRPAINNGELNFLVNHVARISVPDIALDFSVTQINQRLVASINNPIADVCVTATSGDLLLLIAGRADPDTLFFRRRLALSGDTELGLALKNFLDTLDLNTLVPPRLVALAHELAEAFQQLDHVERKTEMHHI